MSSLYLCKVKVVVNRTKKVQNTAMTTSLIRNIPWCLYPFVSFQDHVCWSCINRNNLYSLRRSRTITHVLVPRLRPSAHRCHKEIRPGDEMTPDEASPGHSAAELNFRK